jgi:hypothetical protein
MHLQLGMKESGKLQPLLPWLSKRELKCAIKPFFQSSRLIPAFSQGVDWLQALWKQHHGPCNFKHSVSACLYMNAICNTEGFIKGSKATGWSIFSALLRMCNLLTYGCLAVIVGIRTASLTCLTDRPSFLSSFLSGLYTSRNFSLRNVNFSVT